MSDDTTTTGLAVEPVDDVVTEQEPAQDATDDGMGIHDRLAPPMINSNDAVYADSQIISAETQTSRRILFRVPRTSILDIEGSYLAFQINVTLPSNQSKDFWSQAFPALVGGAGVIDSIIVRIGQQEVQRIDYFAWWMATHYPELTINQQQFVRSYLDLSGTAYSADCYGKVTLGSNPFAMENFAAAPHGRTSGTDSGSNTTWLRKMEYVYQPFGRSVQSHVTIPMMSLCPSLFNSIRRYPAMAAEQLSIELVLNQDAASLLTVGGTLAQTAARVPSDPSAAVKKSLVSYANIASYSIEDPFLMCDFLTLPKPILDAVNQQVMSGSSRYMYTQYIAKQLPISASNDSSTKDVPIRADNSILSELLFMRRKSSSAASGNNRLGAYELAPPFAELNLNINNVNYFEKQLYDGVDLQLQTSRLMDNYYIPSIIYDGKTHDGTASSSSTEGKNGRWMGLFSPVGVPFILESNISRQPILVRHKARAPPSNTGGASFENQVVVWIGRAESLILASSRSRVL
ncbi:hypothetical protein PTSG_03887 [Salpingoeca rosetta]|uniref:Major capsid protein n=1 Tax=Salpingoeca rosetta (strain ATCC 50818 / BSB-021) TaxID=946362 RepID=F2U5P1_SALR5|nr:uncharacterized protein PTSG_03887 [Salpingoeca rosetta]EGD83257.1 hypothetical protein PTSG_03887 [Salpingoeca rosetta]|eukprot:XP_004995621.1 hypothetical protein PTSG_03887 [Salpingoeca rosetta]